jgi:hypothetical protein
VAFSAAKKGTVLIPTGPSHDPNRLHLFVICTAPCQEGKQVIVSIASRVNNLCDQTCILQPHEHAFLTRESYVLYRNARIELQTKLIEGVNRGVFVPHQDVNGQTFLRILKGICSSPQTSRRVKKYAGCP